MKMPWPGDGGSRGTYRNGAHAQGGGALKRGFGQRQARPLIPALIGLMAVIVFTTLAMMNLQPRETHATAPVAQAPVEARTQIEMVDVLIPSTSIDANRLLEPGMFIRVRRPKQGLSAGTVRNFDQIRGQYSRTAIPAQVPLHLDYVTAVRPTNVVTASIPEGFRAVTINVNAISAVEGWAQAGARVDVSWITDRSGQRTASTIVKNVKILSAERQIEPVQKKKNGDVSPIPTTVTLLAGDLDAQKISLASASGNLILFLRGAHDDGDEVPGPITLKDLVAKREDLSDQRTMVRGYVRTAEDEGNEWVVLRDGRMLRKGQL